MAAAILCLGAVASTLHADAQELRCNVEVNAQSIEGTNKSVFETLQTSINDYFNENRFSTLTFSPNERIECRFFLTVKEYENDRIKGEIQAQLVRPVYNTNITTTLFNFRDTRVEFDYREGDPLIFNETQYDNNLTALLNYYAYLFLAIDSDSFSPDGGHRAAVLAAYTDGNTRGMRKLLYDYHRKGLDEMATSPDKGRATITESLKEVKKVHDAAPMSVALSIFRDAKLDELVNIYSKAPATEREEAYEILQPIYPTDNERLDKIKKGDESN